MSEVRKTEGSNIPTWKAYWNAMVNVPEYVGPTLEEQKARLLEQGFFDEGGTTDGSG